MSAAACGDWVSRIIRTFAGPGTIEPWAIVLVTLVAMILRFAVRAGAFLVDRGQITEFLLKGGLLMVIVAATAGLLAVVVPRLVELVLPLRGAPIGRVRYLVELGIIALGTTVMLVVLSNYVILDPVPDVVLQRHIGVVAIATFVLIYVTTIVANGLESSFQYRMNRTEVKYRGELASIRTDHVAILAAEERVRHEIGRTLHDDIQTELLRAAMRLSTLRGLEPGTQRVVDEAVEEIERARERGARVVGRQLAPPLAATGLVAALRDLCDAFRGVLDVEIAVDDAIRARFLRTDDEDLMAIAVYRTVEQGLQNALRHGHARTGRLTLTAHGADAVRLRLQTDGEPPASDWRPGVGSTVINSWTEALGGGWSLTPGVETGAVLEATFGAS